MEEQELSDIAGGNAKRYSHFRRYLDNSVTKLSIFLPYDPAIELHGNYTLKGTENFYSHKTLCVEVFNSSIHHGPNLEANKMSFSR